MKTFSFHRLDSEAACLFILSSQPLPEKIPSKANTWPRTVINLSFVKDCMHAMLFTGCRENNI